MCKRGLRWFVFDRSLVEKWHESLEPITELRKADLRSTVDTTLETAVLEDVWYQSLFIC